MSLAQKTIASSFISLIIKFFERGLGLISTLFLARLLTPNDFGIVAIITIFIYFFEAISVAGTEQYIIQKDTVSDEDVNTAWTLDLCLKLILSIVFFCSATLIGDFYDSKEITTACWVISPVLFISALNNPGIFLLKRAQNYKPIMRLAIIQKSISVVLVIALAIEWENYWAMIVGLLLSAILKLCGSYMIHGYRPSFTLSKVQEQWGFSKWILAKGIIGYGRSQADNFIISAYHGISAIGVYHTFKYIATMPAAQVLGPASEPLLASFSVDSSDKKKLAHKYSLSIFSLLILALPITAFMFSFSKEIVLVLLGDQWVEYANIFKAFSLLFLAYIFGDITSHLLIAIGRLKTLFIYNLVTFIIAVLILFASRNESFEIMAYYRSFFELIATVYLLLFCCIKLNYPLKSFLVLITPLVVINLLVSTLVLNIANYFTWPPLVTLILSGLIFCICYFSCLLFSYVLFYKKTPEGAHLSFIIKGFRRKEENNAQP